MLSIRLHHLMSDKGISKPLNWLRKRGFSHHRASQLLANQASEIKLDQIERLCFFLGCTPNDLFAYTPGKLKPGAGKNANLRTNEVPPPEHPLHTLNKDSVGLGLVIRIGRMYQPKIDQVMRLLDELEKKEKEQKG